MTMPLESAQCGADDRVSFTDTWLHQRDGVLERLEGIADDLEALNNKISDHPPPSVEDDALSEPH